MFNEVIAMPSSVAFPAPGTRLLERNILIRDRP